MRIHYYTDHAEVIDGPAAEVTPGHPTKDGAGYDCACGECLHRRTLVDLAGVLGETDPVWHWSALGQAPNGSAIFHACGGYHCDNPDDHRRELQARTRARYNAWHSSFFPEDPPPHRKPNWL